LVEAEDRFRSDSDDGWPVPAAAGCPGLGVDACQGAGQHLGRRRRPGRGGGRRPPVGAGRGPQGGGGLMATRGDIDVELDAEAIEFELPLIDEVQDDLTARMKRVESVAIATAPVYTGEYRDKIH